MLMTLLPTSTRVSFKPLCIYNKSQLKYPQDIQILGRNIEQAKTMTRETTEIQGSELESIDTLLDTNRLMIKQPGPRNSNTKPQQINQQANRRFNQQSNQKSSKPQSPPDLRPRNAPNRTFFGIGCGCTELSEQATQILNDLDTHHKTTTKIQKVFLCIPRPPADIKICNRHTYLIAQILGLHTRPVTNMIRLRIQKCATASSG